MTLTARFLRNNVASLLLAGVSFFAVVPAFAQNEKKDTGPKPLPTWAADSAKAFLKATPLKKITPAQKLSLNALMIRDAIARQTDKLLKPATAYSKYLDSLETHINDYLTRRDTVRKKDVVVFNPLTYDIGIAYGLSEEQIVARRYPVDGENWDRYASTVAWRNAMPYLSRYGDTTHTPVPTAMSRSIDGYFDLSMIMPMADDAITTPIAGLSRQQTLFFVNAHESWHVRDPYQKTMSNQLIDMANPHKDAEVASSKITQVVFLARQNREAFADVAALGDMIRKGEGFGIIEHIIKWRSENAYDIMHMSPLILKGFRADITAMGLQTFRDMTEKQAEDFYTATTKKYALTMKALEIFMRAKLQDPYGLHIMQSDLDKDTLTADERLALRFAKEIKPRAPRTFDIEMTPEQLKIKEQLNAWDALQALKDKAYALERKITPVSIAYAYAALREDLVKESDDPDKKILSRAKLMRLRNVFTQKAAKIDFVQENLDRKVSKSKWMPKAK